MIQAGTYSGRVVCHEWVTSSAKGTPGLAVRVVIADDLGEQYEMVGTIWITKKAQGFARAQFKALGFNPDKHELSAIGKSVSLVDNEVAGIVVEEDEYKGKVRMRIARFGGARPPTKDELQNATQMLRDAKKKDDEDAYSEEAESPKSPGISPEEAKKASSETRDDVPF